MTRFSHIRRRPLVLILLILALVLAACGDEEESTPSGAGASSNQPTLYIGGIPDQNVATLERQFELVATYLSAQTGMKVRYAPAADYAAIVAAFKRGEVHLVWFGGLTGVQAREAVPGSEAIAHRPRDAEFHSKFIVQADLPAQTLADLKGTSFTFGSESSTSGHLMPRYYLLQAGVDPNKDFKGLPNFSGSHDKTYTLVESGAFQAGALNEAVWDSAVRDRKVDVSKVRVLDTTPAYFDYNWTVHSELDQKFGAGTKDRIAKALFEMRAESSSESAEALNLFATDRFVATNNGNYDAIRQVGESLGMLR